VGKFSGIACNVILHLAVETSMQKNIVMTELFAIWR